MLVLAYYQFISIPDPQRFIKEMKEFLGGKDAKGRIYISEEGINGQMSISEEDAPSFADWIHSYPFFSDLEIKVHVYPEHTFAKMTVKYRKQLAALDASVDVSKTGVHLSAAEWKKWLDERSPNTLLIDVRNDYESKVGRFEGAVLPPLKEFREFPEYVEKLKEEYDPKKTRVMMYCTGGIRCELFSALMKDKGFDEVYQLDGGVIKYGLEQGSSHWEGHLFVFDDRMVVPISEDNNNVISHCCHCAAESDLYYNCANMDCNELFIACPKCNVEMKGCCCASCIEAPRLRAYCDGSRPKPFRKLPYEQKCALSRA